MEHEFLSCDTWGPFYPHVSSCAIVIRLATSARWANCIEQSCYQCRDVLHCVVAGSRKAGEISVRNHKRLKVWFGLLEANVSNWTPPGGHADFGVFSLAEHLQVTFGSLRKISPNLLTIQTRTFAVGQGGNKHLLVACVVWAATNIHTLLYTM